MKKPYPPLFRAIEKQDLEKTRRLVEKLEDVNKAILHPESRILRSPLFMAVSNRFLPAVKLLLDAGANANGSKEDWDHPLIAAAQSDRLDILKLLVEAGGNVNTRITKGYKEFRGLTPLIVAASGLNRNHIVRYLLESGADPKAITATGSNALSEAAPRGNLELCTLLFKAGCPITGKVVLSAVYSGSDDLLRFVLEHGGNPNYVDDGSIVKSTKGTTPLGACLWPIKRLGGKSSSALLLLKHGADPDLPSQEIPPLCYAAGHGYEDVVKAFIKAGANLNCASRGGDTPITWAVRCEQVEIVKLLLKAGADPNHSGPDIRGKPGPTALEQAQRSQNPEIRKLLQG